MIFLKIWLNIVLIVINECLHSLAYMDLNLLLDFISDGNCEFHLWLET